MRSALVALLVLVAAAPADAQVRLRRVYAEGYRLNYGFDHRSGGGCADYACMGACYDGHTGSDFGTPFGTNVLAGAAGRVVQVNDGCADYGSLGNTCGGRCGNYVRLQHDDGSRTLYCHMKRGSLQVRVGDRVSCGQRLGQSASSGSSTGPHLHLGWYASSTSGADDPFRGSCGGPTSLWVEQRGYREAVGTQCQCSASAEVCNGRDDDCDGRVDENGRAEACNGADDDCDGRVDEHARAEVCNGADDDCDGQTDEGEVCEVRQLQREPGVYAAPATTDVDGDGRADVCARGAAGLRCWLSDGAGWPTELPAISWSDASGWDDVSNFATIRMGDLDGDGRADACARANAGVVCALSRGDGFSEPTVWQAELSDANGWDAPGYYTTLRLADVDGDGREDLCARGVAGFDCWRSDGARFATRIEGPRWSDESGWNRARNYGTIRMADLDGDGRADVCARANAGIRCHLSGGDAFGASIEGPALSNASGWGERGHWSSLRLLDFDADGRADLCGRDAEELFCVRFDGVAFGERIGVAALADASGWDDESNYATVRTGDIDGDGGDDLCVRYNVGVRCFTWDGAAFARLDGPAWSDDSGWGAARFYETIRLADVDGDGLGDLCARAAAGWRCHPSRGDAFGDPIVLDDMSDAGGWDALRYWSTIMSASRTCRAMAEVCNGRDDDCDGVIDEHAAAETCNAMDDDCDGAVDEGDSCTELPGGAPDAGPAPLGDGGVPGAEPPGEGPDLTSGCACRAAPASPGAPLAAALPLLALLARRRRRPPV